MIVITRKTIRAEGTSCEHYKNAVESALAELDGVSSAEVNSDESHVHAEYNDSKVTFENTKEAVEEQGYDVK